MPKSKLLTILGYLNIGLAIAHSAGVTAGHFGSGDFITLASEVNTLLLQSIVPDPATATAIAAQPITAVKAAA